MTARRRDPDPDSDADADSEDHDPDPDAPSPPLSDDVVRAVADFVDDLIDDTDAAAPCGAETVDGD